MFDGSAPFGWFDVVALTLTLGGLALAWAQARGATKAAEAAEEAVAATEAQLGMSQLLLVLASVQQVVSDLENAADNENKPVAQFLLLRFGMLAAEAATLLERHDADSRDLPADLHIASEKALDAKAILARSTSVKAARSTEELRGELGRISLRIATKTTNLRFKAGADSNA